jgi:hypothetical protein
MEFERAKSVKQCIEIATLDAYDEYEQVSGWLTCFEEVFAGVGEVEVLGEVVNLAGFDIVGTEVVAVCRRSKKVARVTLDSISPLDATKIQKLWLKAWKEWRR